MGYVFKKIAVLRASGLGDFIFALPALTALRETYVESEIIYLGKEWHKEFLYKRKSLVNRVIVIPPVAGVGKEEDFINDREALEIFFEKLRGEKFDLAVQLHGGGRNSNPFLLNLGAKYTIGTKTPDASDLDLAIPYHYYQNEYLRWLEVVSLVGARTENITPHFEAAAEDVTEAKRVLGKNNRKFIVLHPGATDMKRRWTVERFAQVGDYFANRGFGIVVTGSGVEKDLVDGVITKMQNNVFNFCNRLTINGLAGLFSLCSLVITNDSGPLHLANALNVKTVGIYWCGNLINGMNLFIKNSIALGSWMVNCPMCQRDMASIFPFYSKQNDCKHETSFVAKVSVREVIEAAESLLGRD